MSEWLIALIFLCTAPLWLPWVLIVLGMIGVLVGGVATLTFEAVSSAWRRK